jgi:hypothetical protein
VYVFRAFHVATKRLKLAVGPTNEYGKTYKDIKIGSVIIFDAYVGGHEC